jgi:hypothetical protein
LRSLARLLDVLGHLRLDGLAAGSVELTVIDNRPDGMARQVLTPSRSGVEAVCNKAFVESCTGFLPT